MNIDLTKFRNCWWEDSNGNILETNLEIAECPDGDENFYFFRCFPCRVTTEASRYGYHPKGINKLLIKVPFIKKYIKKKIGKTFKFSLSCDTTLTSADTQKCVVAMVNSGDYTLEQAMWVCANACERCINALINKYLGDGGYDEYSDEWCKSKTRCDFCRTEVNNEDDYGNFFKA